ncbi:MAG: zinc ribbon domain-containing protein [Clostridia bacterium]|nr:zinc ribbon domain-containing protein [Clostridia bacterium]
MNVKMIVLIATAMVIAGGLTAIYVFPAVWTYKDAKERGLNAAFWTIEVILINILGGFLCLGFIAYLIARTLISKIRCPKCNKPCDVKSVYCPSCGEVIQKDEVRKYSKKHNKLLIGIAAGAVIMIVGMGMMFGALRNSTSHKPNVSIGKMEKCWDDVWTIKAKISNETSSKSFDVDEDEPGQLLLSGSSEEGNVFVHVICDEASQSYALTSDDEIIKVDLSDFASKKVELILICDDVKGLHFKADWSNQ